MDARELHIVDRVAPTEFYPSVPANFVLADGGPVAAETVLEPTVTPYCLDDEHRRVLFAQLPAGVDLAAAPFCYLEQYRSAERFIAVPYEVVHRLADGLPDPDLTMVYSTGRCGSTLLSRALNAVDGVRSYSEPDVLSDLATLRHWEPGRDEEYARLLGSCVRLLGRDTGTLAVKPRGGGIHLADLVSARFPAAHNLFLYRNAERWMESMHAGFTGGLPTQAQPVFLRYLLAQAPLLATFAQQHERPLELAEGYALTWLSVLEKYVALRQAGVPFLAVPYEQLTGRPRETVLEVLRWCGLPAGAVDAVLATYRTDSQEGTALSRASRERGTVPPLDADDVALARSVLAGRPTVNTPDFDAAAVS